MKVFAVVDEFRTIIAVFSDLSKAEEYILWWRGDTDELYIIQDQIKLDPKISDYPNTSYQEYSRVRSIYDNDVY